MTIMFSELVTMYVSIIYSSGQCNNKLRSFVLAATAHKHVYVLYMHMCMCHGRQIHGRQVRTSKEKWSTNICISYTPPLMGTWRIYLSVGKRYTEGADFVFLQLNW